MPRPCRSTALPALSLGLALTLSLCLAPATAQAGAADDMSAGARAYAARNYDETLRLFTRALEDPRITTRQQGQAHYAVGLALTAKFQFEAAIKAFDKAIQANPDFAEAWMSRGSAYGCINEWDRSVSDFDQAIRLRPTDHVTIMNRGVTNVRRGYYQRALQDFDQAIAINAGYAPAYAKRAFLHKYMGDVERARADARRALELDPAEKVPRFD